MALHEVRKRALSNLKSEIFNEIQGLTFKT
jgi:hypothetical protein